MANHASSKKAIRQIAKRTERNKHIRTTTRSIIKNARVAIEEGAFAQAEESFKKAAQAIDKAVSKGIFHPKTGSRYISRLAQQVHNLKG